MTTNNDNMFEVATRAKLRFPFRGVVSVEDLWDLSLENLDSVFKVLNSEVKQSKEESLLNKRTKEDEELTVKVEIVKHIVSIKLAEKEAKLKAKEQKEKKQKVMEIISAKQDEVLHSMSVEDLSKMLEEL